MLEHGVDVYSAIEIADNAGRTALFEAVEVDYEPDVIQDTDGNELRDLPGETKIK